LPPGGGLRSFSSSAEYISRDSAHVALKISSRKIEVRSVIAKSRYKSLNFV